MSIPSRPELIEIIGESAETLAGELVGDPGRRAEQLGEIFLLCESIARDEPDAFAAALARGEAVEYLRPQVRSELRVESTSRPTGGWLGTYVGADLREMPSDGSDSTDASALALSSLALQKAISRATADGNETLLRNLGWYRQRLAHRAYEAIAREAERKAATVRTGVARARKYVLKVVHELRSAQPAPLSGDAPGPIEPLRQMWHSQDLDRLEAELASTEAAHGDDPHWLNLAALLAADRGKTRRAVSLYERALLTADAPSVRGRVLNNLGNLFDDLEQVEAAERYWQRAHALVPNAPAPLLNLLAAASQRRDYAAAQHFVAELADRMNSGRLTAAERSYVCRRLVENPKLGWLRDTDTWRLGPARWIKGAVPGTRRIAGIVAAILIGLLAVLAPDLASATPRDSGGSDLHVTAHAIEPVGLDRARGGDSMGKPPKHIDPEGPERLLAGDSMGRSKGRGKIRPPRG